MFDAAVGHRTGGGELYLTNLALSLLLYDGRLVMFGSPVASVSGLDDKLVIHIPGCWEKGFVRLNLSVWITHPDIAQDALGTLLSQFTQHHVQVLDTFLKVRK